MAIVVIVDALVIATIVRRGSGEISHERSRRRKRVLLILLLYSCIIIIVVAVVVVVVRWRSY